jgi:hypothetical protein
MAQRLIPERHNTYCNLLVLRHDHTRRNGAYWSCLCTACGSLCTVLGSALRAGRTRSCGCMRTSLLSLRAAERNRANRK